MSNQPPQNPYDGQQPAPQGGYGAAPQMQGGGMHAPANVAKPKSIDLAVKAMYAGAVVAALNILFSILMADTIKDSLKERLGDAVTQAEIDQAFSSFNLQAILGGIIGIAFWVGLALANNKGMSWARIVGTVLFAINTIFTLISLIGGNPLILMLLGLLQWVCGLVAVIFLWKSDSTAYFKNQGALRASR